MKRMFPIAMLLLAACSPAQPASTEPTDPVVTDPAPVEPDPVEPEPTEPVVGPDGMEAQAHLIELLAANKSTDPETWTEEMRLTLHPNGMDALVGATVAALTAALGEPDGDAGDVPEGTHAWNIGVLPEGTRSAPPVLIVTVDEAGVVTAVRVQLAM